MNTSEILAELDAEISRLQHVRDLLTGTKVKPGSGRTSASTGATPGKRRSLSPEAREKMAAAQRARRAREKKTAK